MALPRDESLEVTQDLGEASLQWVPRPSREASRVLEQMDLFRAQPAPPVTPAVVRGSMSQGEVADSLAVEDGGVALAGHEDVEQLDELLERHGEPTRRLASDRQGPSDVRATPIDRPDSSGRCLHCFASWGAALAGAR